MKILYFITKSEAGGAQTHVYQLCRFFHAKYDITVVAYPGGWLEDKCKELGITFIANEYFSNSMNPFNVLKSYVHIKKIIKNVQPDILHCHSSVAGFLGRLAVRNKIPTLFTAHGWGFNIGVDFFQKWIAIIAEKIVSRYTSRIICVSQFVKNLGLKYSIASEEKFDVIYNGVEMKEKGKRKTCLPARQEEKGGDKINFVFVGRLAAPKRPLLLLKAIELLPLELKNKLHISIVGEGRQKTELETYISEHDMQCVSVEGTLEREDVFDILQRSDIFVLLSDWEGLPITILEAMSCRLPVVASDVGGIREVVDETNGILVNNDESSIVEALKKITSDVDIRQRMGDESYRKIQKQFSIDTMLEKTEQLYKAVVR